MRVLVDHNRADFSRRHCVNHQLRRIVIPQHNIDALVIEIIGDRLHACTTHTDTSAHRINPCVLALDGDLGALAWVSSRTLNLNDALGDLWNFDTEQLNQHIWRNSRHQQLRPASIIANAHKDGTGAIVDSKYFTSDQFFSRQKPFSIIAKVDHNMVASHFFDGAVEQFTNAVFKPIDDQFSLGIFNSLHDDLLGRLRRDTPKCYVVDVFFKGVTNR